MAALSQQIQLYDDALETVERVAHDYVLTVAEKVGPAVVANVPVVRGVMRSTYNPVVEDAGAEGVHVIVGSPFWHWLRPRVWNCHKPCISPVRERCALSRASLRGSLIPVAAFANHVGRVLGRGADEKMSRVHAQRNVAGMADEQTRRDRPVMQLPRDTMRAAWMSIETDQTVAIEETSALPYPAVVFVDRVAGMEPLNKRLSAQGSSCDRPSAARVAIAAQPTVVRLTKPSREPWARASVDSADHSADSRVAV